VLDAALEAIPHGLCMMDADERLVLINRRALDMYNVSPALVTVGMPLRQLTMHAAEAGNLTPAAVEEILVRRRQRMARREPFDTRRQLLNGRTLALHYR